jgi:hypothetical protein
MKDIIKQLREDKEYYGSFGRSYLSNSDIGVLLNNPKLYGVKREDNLNFMKGRLFHQILLEPNKTKDWNVVDVSSRNTKAYKEQVAESGENFLLLKKEWDEMHRLSDIMKGNSFFHDSMYAVGNKFEEPNVMELCGLDWKGKADIVTEECVIDVKTSGDIKKFHYTAKAYNYDSQAYIYQMLFDRPLVFYVIDKTTEQLGVFTTTDAFLDKGREKVERAVEVYNKFFSKNSTEDINQYFLNEELF